MGLKFPQGIDTAVSGFSEKLKTIPETYKKYAEEIKKSEDLIKASTDMVQNMSKDLDAGVSVDSLSTAMGNFDSGWDKVADEFNKRFNASSAKTKENILAVWAKDNLGEGIFNAGSAIKNGSSIGLSGVSDILKANTTFAGSYRNPIEAAQKIKSGVELIVTGTQKIANSLGIMSDALFGKDGKAPGKEVLNTMSNLSNTAGGKILNNTLRVGAGATAGIVGAIGTVEALKTGGFSSAIDAAKATISSVKSMSKDNLTKNSSPLKAAANPTDGLAEEVKANQQSAVQPQINETTVTTSQSNDVTVNSTGSNGGDTSSGSGGAGGDGTNFGANIISNIEIILGGKNPSERPSEVAIDGVEYVASGYSISQNLLSPMTLSFSLRKKDQQEENAKDVAYSICGTLIGQDIELRVTTTTVSGQGSKGHLVFKGVIMNVSASRGVGGSPSYNVSATTRDGLLDANPNCRSFTDMTLKDIVSQVLQPYSELAQNALIAPRLEDKIPYVVQYHQSDFDFLTSLAQRFGEWMYNDGEHFVFGKMHLEGGSCVKLYYPGGNMFNYGVNLSLKSLNFSNAGSNMLKYRDEKAGICNYDVKGEYDKKTNRLGEAATVAAERQYTARNIQFPNRGGYDNGEDEDVDTLLRQLAKIEARGRKAQMFMGNGGSKIARLQIGQSFEINDGVVNNSRIEEKEDIVQEPLMIIGINHSFDYGQEYSNSFEAIPASCDYPPYTTANIYPYSAPQRATVIDNVDKKNLGRVRVQFPWQAVQDKEKKMITPWLRISQPYGGASKGVQFIPEVGEEVMIGFEMDNAERPYVMGTLFNGCDCPDEEWHCNSYDGGTSNNVKAIRTRNGHTIQFIDNAQGGYIQIYDYEKNTYILTFSTDEKLIRLEAQGNVEIVAGNDIIMKAKNNITVEAGKNISVKSGKDTDVKADANMSIAAENNMDQKAADIFVNADNSITEKSGNSIMIKTKKLQEKASATASIDGGTMLEMTATMVKVR